ncbi:hypothetical protein HDC37_001392 [Microbacterium sp. AK009]|uniref:hypothetical protein n=1 Tax=Microbacterium sp. AK009 TaxID=2723068 RepID=UPI0015C8F74B|nr:hypothetical protein [Microbacterium sp. AK009]NYF16567.1 hypothetical protein [Microbacterium sp. AK009]
MDATVVARFEAATRDRRVDQHRPADHPGRTERDAEAAAAARPGRYATAYLGRTIIERLLALAMRRRGVANCFGKFLITCRAGVALCAIPT